MVATAADVSSPIAVYASLVVGTVLLVKKSIRTYQLSVINGRYEFKASP